MRVALVVGFVIAWSGSAAADDCTGDDASSADCDAMVQWYGKHHAPVSVSLSSGFVSDVYDPTGHTFEVKEAGTAAPTLGRFAGTGMPAIRGDGFFLDVRLHATPIWYAALDLRASWADLSTARFAPRGDAMAWDGAMLMTMAGVVGARLPLGRLSLRGELVAGLHGASLSDSSNGTTADGGVSGLVEPRLALDVWLHHWWVVEAFAGVNALDRSERVLGIGLGFHSQAFDGAY